MGLYKINIYPKILILSLLDKIQIANWKCFQLYENSGFLRILQNNHNTLKLIMSTNSKDKNIANYNLIEHLIAPHQHSSKEIRKATINNSHFLKFRPKYQ